MMQIIRLCQECAHAKILNKIISECNQRIKSSEGIHDIWDEAVADFANDILDIIEEYGNDN